MVISVLLIIAFWMLPLPAALQVLMTIFGSLNVLLGIIKIIAKCVSGAEHKSNEDLLKELMKR